MLHSSGIRTWKYCRTERRKEPTFIDKSKDFLYSSFAGSYKQQVWTLVSSQTKFHTTLQQKRKFFRRKKAKSEFFHGYSSRCLHDNLTACGSSPMWTGLQVSQCHREHGTVPCSSPQERRNKNNLVPAVEKKKLSQRAYYIPWSLFHNPIVPGILWLWIIWI
jgi:hypothetical protein